MEEPRTTERRKKEKDDGLFSVTVCQIIFSVIAVLSLLVISRGAGKAAENLKEDFKTLMSVSFCKDDFVKTVKGIKDYLSSPAEISVFKLFSKGEKGEEKEKNYSEETSASGSSAESKSETEIQKAESEPKKTEPPSTYEETTKPKTTTAEKTTEKVKTKKTSLSLSKSTNEKKASVLTGFSPDETILSPVSGRYSSYYGYRINPITGNNTLHTGVDIAASQGTKIKAAYSGVVRKVGEDSRSGKYLYLTHANGSETLYCHCSKILAEEGAVIRKGETIALVGSTGWSTGPHLHFEIHKNGERLDPLPFLEK